MIDFGRHKSMNISLRQLKCFVAVAQHQNFTRAAQELHTTQSAVSLIVKDLEQEVGFRLFDRTTRQVALSEAGQEFYRMASRLLEEFQMVVRDASDIAALRRGVVRVGAAEAVAFALVVPAMAAYEREHPGIEVQLEVTLVPDMFHALRQGEVDIIVGPDSMRHDEIDRTIAWEALAQYPLWVWCPPTHVLAQDAEVAWSAMLPHDLVIPAVDFTTGITPAVMDYLGVSEVDRSLFETQARRRRVSNITAALSMARAGLGVTFAAEYVRPLASAFGLVGRPLVKPHLDRQLVLYRRRGRTLSPAAADFAGFFRQFVVHFDFG